MKDALNNEVLAEKYCHYLKNNRNLEEKTVTLHRRHLGCWEAFLAGRKKVFSEARAEDVMDWILLRQKEVKARTIRTTLCILKQFYDYLRRFEKIMTAPLDAIPQMVCEPSPESRYLSVEECLEFLKGFDKGSFIGLRNFTICALLWSTGLRSAELCALTWGDIDLYNEFLRVSKGKGRKQRQIYLNTRVKNDLELYRKEALPESLDEPVFYNLEKPRGTYPRKALSVRTLADICDAQRKSLGWEKRVSPKDFRHSFATHMFERGVRINDIKEMMGHDVESETTTYIHVTLETTKNLLRAHLANPECGSWRVFQ